MPLPALGVALPRLLSAAVRFLVRTLVARVAEQMRDSHSAVGWLVGGTLVIVALPAMAALLMGFLLQAAVFGPLAVGAAEADASASGWLRRAEAEASPVGIESPSAWSWPVAGRLTAHYGGCTFAMCPHWGIDIAGLPGTPVSAAADGVVAAIGWDPDGYGHFVVLAHGGGWQTLYAHLHPPAMSGRRLTVNMAVRRGDPIGALGSSGASTGPHLHWEVWLDGARVDPARVLRGSVQGADGLRRLPSASSKPARPTRLD